MADDFLLGFAGPKEEAETIKARLTGIVDPGNWTIG